MAAKGLDKVLKNLNKELKKIENKTVGSLVKAAILIQRDMEYTPPLTPVDYGNLRSSYFIASVQDLILPGEFEGPQATKLTSFSTSIVSNYAQKARASKKGRYNVYFGFSAYYAARVHELSGAKFKRPGAGPFFFEASVKRNTATILELVRNEAQIR